MKKRTPKNVMGANRPSVEKSSLIQALRRGGFLAPKTDDEAHQCLDQFSDSSITLPPALEDTDAAVSRIFGERVNLPMKLQNRPETEQANSLRQAARKGGDITPEIEEAMKQAREARTTDE